MKFFSLLRFLTVFCLVGLFACSPSAEPGGLEWKQGWVRAMPPGRSMTAAYGELRNTGQEALQLLDYDSDAFASVSLHQSTTENGISRMQEQGIVQLESGESLSLEPGGLHLMLMRATRDLEVGDEIEIGVITPGERYVFKIPVEAR